MREGGESFLDGQVLSVELVVAGLAKGEPLPVGWTMEQAAYAVLYDRARAARRARRLADPKRAKRLQGKRNAAAGARAEAWIVRQLGPSWRVAGRAGHADVVYQGLGGSDALIHRIESKRCRGGDLTLRRALRESDSQAVVRSYGGRVGPDNPPLVTMEWGTFALLLRLIGQCDGRVSVDDE